MKFAFGLLLVLVATVLLASSVSAADIKWTGYANDNQWTTQNNWYPNTVPGTDDDVTIEKGAVICTIPTGVKSLVMGTNVDGPANLTLHNTFIVQSKMDVKGNGNLILDLGITTAQGTFNIDGNLRFISGYVSGKWTVSSRGTAVFPGQGQRNLAAVSFVVQGSLDLSGVVGFNQSAILVNQGSVSVASANFQVFDKSSVSFDSSAQGSTLNINDNVEFHIPVLLNNIVCKANQVGLVQFFDRAVFGSQVQFGGFMVQVSGAGSANFAMGASMPKFSLMGGSATFGGSSNTVGELDQLGGDLSGVISVTNFTVEGGRVDNGTVTVNGHAKLTNAIVAATIKSTGPTHIHSSLALSGSLVIADAAKAQNVVLTILPKGSITVSAGVLTLDGVNITGTGSNDINLVNGVVEFTNVTTRFNNVAVAGDKDSAVAVNGPATTMGGALAAGKVSVNANGSLSGSQTALQINTLQAAAANKPVSALLGGYTVTCPTQCLNVVTPGSTEQYSFFAAN